MKQSHRLPAEPEGLNLFHKEAYIVTLQNMTSSQNQFLVFDRTKTPGACVLLFLLLIFSLSQGITSFLRHGAAPHPGPRGSLP